MMTAEETPRTVRVNDVDLAYVTAGQGDPVVFVHGSVNDYRSWTAQLAPFATHYQVVAYSRRCTEPYVSRNWVLREPTKPTGEGPH